MHALQIAEAMVAGNIDVEVGAVCIGPCAQYILVAGRSRRIAAGSLVAFHLSGTAVAAIGTLLGDDLPADFRPGLQKAHDLAASEARLYRERGVSTSLLHDALMAVQPHCVMFHRGPEREAQSVSLNQLTYGLWVPTRKQLQAAGLAFEGYWPRSRREMSRLAASLIRPAGREQSIRFGNEDHLRRQRGDRYAFENLRECVLEQDPTVETATAGSL